MQSDKYIHYIKEQISEQGWIQFLMFLLMIFVASLFSSYYIEQNWVYGALYFIACLGSELVVLTCNFLIKKYD
ncbi:hypothetical protein CQ054_21645 [Ochrobactrum sp. MYb29]|nr:hypothetical protein CWE02_09740 [Brucella pituitosa]PRA79375.1 hypothetical protein CQ054_21645 [Ochrobactrum sp. MYb29]TCQ72360.1 hypothetical protein EDF68_1229 [Ochrobactrum sp. BH3]